MARFAARGWRVTYVEQLGIRNPRPRHVARALSPDARRRSGSTPFEVVSPKLLPPRRAPLRGRGSTAAGSRGSSSRASTGAAAGALGAVPDARARPAACQGHPWRSSSTRSSTTTRVGPGMNAACAARSGRPRRRSSRRPTSSSRGRSPSGSGSPRATRTCGWPRRPSTSPRSSPWPAAEGAERTAVFTGELGFRFDVELAAAGGETAARLDVPPRRAREPGGGAVLAGLPNVAAQRPLRPRRAARAARPRRASASSRTG